MRPWIRQPVAVRGVTALLTGGWLAARWAGMALPDLGLTELRRLRAEDRRREALAGRCEALVESNRVKTRVARELIEQRLTLSEAAAEFRRLHEANGIDLQLLASWTGTASEEEALTHTIFAWVSAELMDGPADQRAAVLRRLEAEYADAFHHPYHGGALAAE
jgi:hypothetical protein